MPFLSEVDRRKPCLLRHFPPEIIAKILIFATLGEPRMPRIIKVLRKSSDNQDMYRWALYYYYTRNPMTLTIDNLEWLVHMNNRATEPVRELRIAIGGSVKIGRPKRMMLIEDNGNVRTVIHQRLDNYTVKPFPKWTVMEKFGGLREFHIDLRAYPLGKYYMVHDLLANIRRHMPAFTRLVMDIKFTLELPMTYIEHIVADPQVPEHDRVEAVWEIIVDTFWKDIPPCMVDVLRQNDSVSRLLNYDFIVAFVLPALAGLHFGIHDILDAVRAIGMMFDDQARDLSGFLGNVNSLLGVNGMMQNVNVGQFQTFVWDFSTL